VNEAGDPRQKQAAGAAAETAIDPATPLFRVRSFRLLFTTRAASNTANHMLAVIIGWQVYELTDSALALGLIGLVQFLPPLLLILLAGPVADRYNRRLILRSCYAVKFFVCAGLAVVSLLPRPDVSLIFLLAFLHSLARTFEQPALQSLLFVMVPREIFGRAVAAFISAGKLSALMGPPLGGVLYIFGAAIDYAACALLVLAAVVASFLLPDPHAPAERPKLSWDTLVAGFRFIWRCPAVLGAMTMDLMAVLCGGVNAMLPIYARDILQIGPWGAGILRAAPAVGALFAAAYLARFPIDRAGSVYLFGGFAVYGAATVGFAISDNVALSICMLMLIGCGEMVSTVVRQTLIQMSAPDAVRGRVSAVNGFFTGTSDHLGAFRAGVMAAWIGAVGSVALGGVVVLASVAVWLWMFPALRRVSRLDVAQPY
jgi:MFS family permease